MQKQALVRPIALVLLALLWLVACNQEEPAPEVQPEPTEAATATPVEEAVPETAAETAAIAAADYQNIPWAWVEFTDPVNGPQPIPEPERYQIVFNEDGTVNIQADCNVVGGAYMIDGASISIELGPSTLAACPEDSLADEFTQQLSQSTIVFFDGADMLFDLPADAGTMRFSQMSTVAPEASQPVMSFSDVADQLWVLVGYDDALNPTVVEEGTLITAYFDSNEGQVSGRGGCNNYFSTFLADDAGVMQIDGPFGATMMACETGMEQEAAYLAALETVSAWSLSEEGRLQLTYDTGQVYDEVLIYAPGDTPLTDTTWRLVSFGDPEDLQAVEAGTSVTAIFSPETDTTGAVGGNATCNSYSGGYEIDGDQISVGPIAGTLMLCPVGADQEQAYLAALQTAESFEILGANLQIVYDGGVLNFTSLDLPLENVLWQAAVVGDQFVPEETVITALFDPGEEPGMGGVGGSAGCNNYSTSYETSSDDSTDPPTQLITINSPMAMTLALCPDEALAALEQSYIGALETVESYEIHGDQMTLHTAEGDVLYVADREPLLGTLWTLISLGNVNDPQPPVEGSNFTAQFSRLPTLPTGTVTGGTGCNEYNATFTANLDEIKINLPATTQNEDCPWGAGNFEVEQQFFLGMNAATSYRILGNVLQLPYGEGEDRQALTFEGSPPPGEEALDLSPLNNTFWYLSAIGENPILPGTEVTAGFAIAEDGVTGMVSGSGGCNAYNAEIGENFAMGPIASTRRACEQPIMDQEGGYFDWLSGAYDFDRAGDQLLISTANGVLTYNSTPVLDQSLELQNVTWHLLSAGTLTAVPGSGATAIFAADGRTLSGNTGCNEYTGSYAAGQGNTLAISGFSATQSACPTEALTRQEEALLIFLQSAVSYTVNGTQMQIQTVDGSTVNFTSIPPAQPTPPTAVISGPTQANVGDPLSFSGASSIAGSLPIVSYDWDMGDGTRLSGVAVQYTYQAAGSYSVQLTVTDQAGQTNSAFQTIQVQAVAEAVPPTAAIEGPTTAIVGESVTFSAASSTEGSAAISTYQWQSGDGNNSEPLPDNSFSTIYSRPGAYYPVVTVADADGLSDSASMEIVINANLEGTEWLLTGTAPGTSITLTFANGTLSGFAGCNSYSGGYTSTRAAGSSNEIMVGPLAVTQALCDEPIMNQEQAYLASLGSASSYAITGTTLTLTTADGPLTFAAAVATPLPLPAP